MMAGPWEDYAPSPGASGPWEDYAPSSPQSVKPQAPVTQQDKRPLGLNSFGEMVEPLAAMGSGMVAGPVSDIAGLVDIPLHAAGISKTLPEDVKSKVQKAMTYAPTTRVGQAMTQYNPISLVGQGIEKLASMAQRSIAPPASSGPARSVVGDAAKGVIENLPNLLGAKLGRASEAALPGKIAAAEAARKAMAPELQLEEEARASGYKVPSQTGIKAKVSGMIGRTRETKELSQVNEKNAREQLSQEVGIPKETPPTEEARDAAKETQYQAYRNVEKALPQGVRVTNEFRSSMQDTLRKLESQVDVHPEFSAPLRIVRAYIKRTEPGDATAGIPARSPIENTIAKVAQEQPQTPIGRTLEQAASETPGPVRFGAGSAPLAPSVPITTFRMPSLSTSWVMGQISDLRKAAKASYRKGDWETAQTRMGIAHQLENMIDSNLSQAKSPLLPQFRNARVKLAQLHLLDRIADDTTGRIDLQRLAALSKTPAYRGVLTGAFKQAADFARNFSKATQRQTGEPPPSLSVLDSLFLVGGIGGAIAGHPGALLAPASEMGARLIGPAMMRRGMFQNPVAYPRVPMSSQLAQYLLPLLGEAASSRGP